MAERRSFRAAVKELEERLQRALVDRGVAQHDLDTARERFNGAQATYFALRDAYDLVKPKPRVRKVKAKGDAV